MVSEVLGEQNLVIAKHANEYANVFGSFTVSVLTVFEIQKGLVHQRKPAIENAFRVLLRTANVLPIGKEEALLAGTLYGLLKRRGIRIGEVDPMIAATAIENNLPLVTGNTLHYRAIAEMGFPLQLLNWRDP